MDLLDQAQELSSTVRSMGPRDSRLRRSNDLLARSLYLDTYSLTSSTGIRS